MPGHALNAAFVKQICAIFNFQIYVVATVGQHQREVKLRGSALGQDRFFNLQPVQPDERELLIAITPVKHNLEEGGVTQGALGLNFAHHFVKGRRAMGIKIKHALLHPKQQFAKAQVSGKPRSQYMSVQKKSDHELQFWTVPISQRNSKKDVLLAAVAIEQSIRCSGKDSK